MPELETRRQPELAMEHSMCRQVAVKLLAGPSSSAQRYPPLPGSPLGLSPPRPALPTPRRDLGGIHRRQAGRAARPGSSARLFTSVPLDTGTERTVCKGCV